MKRKKYYAYKMMLPALWQAVFYLIIMMGACLLVMGSPYWWDKALTVILILGACGFTFYQIRRFMLTYYCVFKSGVLFMQNGVAKRHKFSDLEDVQFDSARMGIQLVFNNGYVETHMEYNDFTPLIEALDAHGIRIEYKKMGKDPAREMGGPTIVHKGGGQGADS